MVDIRVNKVFDCPMLNDITSGGNILRFITREQYIELINLYHLANTALAGKSPGRWERMVWASKEFHKLHPNISESAAYKDLSANL